MATLKKHKLSFAKKYGWVDQTDEPIGDIDNEGIVSLHGQNPIEIPLCNCYRCMRFKLRKKVITRETELERVLLPEERSRLNDQVIAETDRDRNKARLKGLYI